MIIDTWPDFDFKLVGAQARVHGSRSADENIITKLIVRAADLQIKIEVTPVMRGAVYDPALIDVAPAVESEFGFATTLVVSEADLYAGKIVAALDRKQPQDLFDVRDLLAHDGISHNRTMAWGLNLMAQLLHC